MRRRLCRSCGDIHTVGQWPHNCIDDSEWPRSDYPSPYVISDALPGGVNGLYHHGVARKIDSKAAYRKATKESGCVEVGNEFAATRTREYRDNTKADAFESAVNDALHRQGVSSESDVGDFIV